VNHEHVDKVTRLDRHLHLDRLATFVLDEFEVRHLKAVNILLFRIDLELTQMLQRRREKTKGGA